MPRRIRYDRFVIASATLLVAACTASAQVTSQGDRTRLFAWFDTLGYDAIKGGQFVEIDPFYSKDVATLVPPLPIYGFLKKETRTEFTILTPELFEESFKKRPATRNDRGGRMKQADLAAWIVANKSRFEPNDFALGSAYGIFGMAPLTKEFILARACESRRLPALSQTMFDAIDLQVRNGRKRSGLPSSEATIKDDLAGMTLCRIVQGFGDPPESRPEMLRRFEAFTKEFPEYGQYGQVQARLADFALKATRTLQTMTSEDEQHARQTITPYEQMTPDQQIDECLFELRDQKGRQWIEPGSVDVFHDSHGPSSPAERLAKFGLKAVPKLIKTLDDDRFTRSVRPSRRSLPDQRDLRVGEVAAQILQKIAGRSFTYPDTGTGSLRSDRWVNVRKWWDDVQTRGEETVLKYFFYDSPNDVSSTAAVLVERYPADALKIIAPHLKQIQSYWKRSEVLRELAKLRSPECAAFMKDVMLHGESYEERMVGATAVTKTDPKLAFAQLIDMWDHAKDLQPGSTDYAEVSQIIWALAATCKPEALDALANGIHGTPPETRAAILFWLGNDPESLYREMNAIGGRPSASQEPAYRRALEKLLAGELEDTDFAYRNVTQLLNPDDTPRICDSAAQALARDFPEKYKLAPAGTKHERVRDLVLCLNTWRRENGEAPATVPPLPKPLIGGDSLAIRSVILQGDSNAAPQIAARARELQGARLSHELLASFVLNVADHWTSNLTRLQISFDRDHGGALILTVVFNPAGQQPRSDEWGFAESVRVNGVSIGGSSGSMSKYQNLLTSTNVLLPDTMTRILAVPATGSIEMHLVLIHSVLNLDPSTAPHR